MKNIIYLFIVISVLLSCKSANMGKAKYGKGGAIDSGYVNTKCTYPSKRYVKDLDAKVKLSFDSLALSGINLDAGVKQTVTKLSDYTSEGLDLDLILFHICQTSLNKGFTKEQTAHLMEIAIDAWAKKKPNQQ